MPHRVYSLNLVKAQGSWRFGKDLGLLYTRVLFLLSWVVLKGRVVDDRFVFLVFWYHVKLTIASCFTVIELMCT